VGTIEFRHLAPELAIKQPAPLGLVGPAPLLEVEADAGFYTGVSELPNPLGVHRSGLRTRFTTRNDPVEPSQGDVGKGGKKGLATEKPHRGGAAESFGDGGRSW